MNNHIKLMEHKQNDTSNSEILFDDFAILKADLLAMMTQADGEVLEIEKSVSKAILDMVDTKNLRYYSEGHIKSQFLNSLKQDSDINICEADQELLRNLSLYEQSKLIKELSAIATCDGNLHHKEKRLIENLMTIMGLTETASQHQYRSV